MTTRERTRDHLARVYPLQPRVGDVLENGRWGPVEVLGVHEHGRVLDVRVRDGGHRGHELRIGRHPEGCWLRVSGSEGE